MAVGAFCFYVWGNVTGKSVILRAVREGRV